MNLLVLSVDMCPHLIWHHTGLGPENLFRVVVRQGFFFYVNSFPHSVCMNNANLNTHSVSRVTYV